MLAGRLIHGETMANPKKRLPENVPGDFFVDSTCIDCDTCRQIAPQVFAEGDGAIPLTGQLSEAFFGISQCAGVGGVVVEADDRKVLVHTVPRRFGVDVAGPFIIEADDDEGIRRAISFDVHRLVAKNDQPALFEAFLKIIGAAFAFAGDLSAQSPGGA